MTRPIFCTEGIIKFVDDVVLFFSDCLDNPPKKETFKKEIIDDDEICEKFYGSLPLIKEKLNQDLVFFLESDPAVINEDEVIFAYPGYRAVTFYRIAHLLHDLGQQFVARVISEHAHFLTGIDIHPGAQIGCPFFIDHGTGIVIGETAVVGNHVKMYQGVTLGALSLGKGAKLKGTKRHPTIGDNVTIYSGASILGGDVTIGSNVVIGSNVYLIESIPDNCKVVIQKPELKLMKK